MGNKYLNTLRTYRYHSNQKREANMILKSIEEVKGKTDRSLIKKADAYAINVLGSKKYAPWLYVYSAMAGEFKEGWIPDNYYGEVVVPNLKGHYGAICDLKALNQMFFDSELFPDSLYRVNSLWLTPDYVTRSKKYVEQQLFSNDELKYVFKLDNTARGEGIYIIDKQNYKYKNLISLGNGVLQTYINQHSFFNKIITGSVATIRLTSFIDISGEVSIRGGYLRVGRKSDKFIRSKSTLRIPIDVHSGTLSKGYLPNWKATERHPDTGFVFKGKVIPEFEKCLTAVKQLHKKVPFTRTVGWDLVIDDKSNVKVMEWNGLYNDIKFSEATQGPIFKGLGFERLSTINK